MWLPFNTSKTIYSDENLPSAASIGDGHAPKYADTRKSNAFGRTVSTSARVPGAINPSPRVWQPEWKGCISPRKREAFVYPTKSTLCVPSGSITGTVALTGRYEPRSTELKNLRFAREKISNCDSHRPILESSKSSAKGQSRICEENVNILTWKHVI